MKKYIITTDMTADYPVQFAEKDFYVIDMAYILDGVLYDGKSNPYLCTKDFYSALAMGKTSSTSMVTTEEAKEFFGKFLKEGHDVLHVGFSSALSGCYESYVSAVKELEAIYPNNKVVVVDSLSATLGEGLLVYYALRKRDEGATIDENAEYLNELRHHIGHVFTVDDMNHLYRGGRVSKTTAVVGEALKMKPVLMVSHEGKLVPTNTMMGRKLALRTLVDKMVARTKGYDNKVAFIGSCDADADAQALKKMVEDKFPGIEVHIGDISPIVGSHLGKGGLTLHYLCSDKIPFRF
ncbi:MAG: DegV family protein [Clostridia bacterium]|nr:DegV family protein [Clostridia bacterium]